MTITADTHAAAAVRITAGLTWSPHQAWSASSTRVDGQLSDGRRLVVATYGDHDLARLGVRVDATHEWLHYGVLVIDSPVDDIPTLVVPVDRLHEGLVAEAVRRWLLARRHPHALAS